MRVYTAVYGRYDSLHAHPHHPEVEEWVCYTDDPELQGPGWRIVLEPSPYPHPRLAAKWYKCHPPLPGNTLWIDGSVAVTSPTFIDAVAEGLSEARMTMFRHPWRDCIYEEIGASIGMLKYAGLEDVMVRQVNHYSQQGWKPHAGLWASTVIGRRGNSRDLDRFGAAWFAHCELFSYQDQLSLPPLLDAYGVTPAALPYSLTDNPWFQWLPHHRND